MRLCAAPAYMCWSMWYIAMYYILTKVSTIITGCIPYGTYDTLALITDSNTNLWRVVYCTYQSFGIVIDAGKREYMEAPLTRTNCTQLITNNF